MSDHPVYSTPARYRVLADAYVDDVYYTASTDQASVFVDYAGHPGTALQPIDGEGRRRQAAYFAKRGTTAERALSDKSRLTEGTIGPAAVPAAPPPAPPAEIPVDWRSFSAGARVLLAARLGAPETCDDALLADEFIEAEIARRTTTAREG
jgi:hypothetical protein